MKLVLLPGLDGTGRLFGPLAQALPADLSPVIISYPADQRLSYAELVHFVSERLPAAEDFVLLAESFSGPVAIEIGARQAENLKALILSATFVSSPTLVPQILSFLIREPAFVFEPPRFFIGRYLLGEEPPSDLVESFRQATRSVRPDVLASRMRSVVNVDVRRAFEACRLPILYLQAKRDRLVKARSLAEMQKIRPEMTIVEIEGPHLLLQREPARCVAAIADYLRAR
jgi:pimeloyl-ACP methyl ester carboxylesterase